MAFHPNGQFQQFPHCKFRENVVRLLYIPSIMDHSPHQGSPTATSTYVFLAVNKFGKVGLYHPDKFSLVHTYCLDLSVPQHVIPNSSATSNRSKVIPKCERTHLVTDAEFSSDANCIIFSTTKSLLQWYDVGDIQRQDMGLGLFPRKEFLTLRDDSFPLDTIPNKGHVECHRLFGLNSIPTSIKYYERKLIIGDVEGGVTLIGIPNPKYPLGRRKIRGKLHKIHLSELPHGVVQYYKGHHHPITGINLIPERNLILTSSKDKKFSVYVKDTSDTPVESIIVSIPKGVNSIDYSSELKMVATGSDDYVVRLFNQFVMKMPQMEMYGHRSFVIAVKFVQVDFYVTGAEQGDKPVLLLSYSADTELRAWDPLTFICLQSLYLSFPIGSGSTIMCKTPEFATHALLIFQTKDTTIPAPPVSSTSTDHENSTKSKAPSSSRTEGKTGNKGTDGMIILLYCNSYARIPLEKEGAARWPGINYDRFIQEFEELSMEYDKKLKDKLKEKNGKEKAMSKPSIHVQHQHRQSQGWPKVEEEGEDKGEDEGKQTTVGKHDGDGFCLRLSKEEMSQMEAKVDAYLKEILGLRRTIQQEAIGTSVERSTGRLTGSILEGGDEDDQEGFSSPSAVDDPLAISIQATNHFFEFRRAKQDQFKGLPKSLQRRISYGHAFNHHPLQTLEPLQFSRGNLALPEVMKKKLGITSVNSVQDLMTPEAQRYFALELTRRNKSQDGTGTSLFCNENHSQHKSKKRSHEDQTSHKTAGASQFTVVGQKLRNVYEEDEIYLLATTTECGEELEQDNYIP